MDFSDLGAIPAQSSKGGIDFSDLGAIKAAPPSYAEQLEPGIYGQTSPTGQRILENLGTVAGGYGIGTIGANIAKAGISGIGKLAGKVMDVRNAPKALEDALSSAGRFGTSETPSMVGNTARSGLESEQSANEALAQKLYGKVDKNVSVNTPKLASQYQSVSDELPPSLGNAIKKNVQLEPNPIRPNDIGTTNTPAQYSASPGVPSQLPPNNPSVGDLITLRSKLGAASRMGGVDGFNAGKLRAALDEDIANIGAGEGPLGKMTNDVTNEPLKYATNYYREVMQQQGTPLYRKLATSKVEDIPDIIFKNGRTQDVLEARAALGENGYQAVKKSFFNDLINSKSVGKSLDKFSTSNSDFLPTVFNEQELGSLKTVADLQQRAVDAAKTAERAKKLITVAGSMAVGGGIAGKAIKFGMGDKWKK